MISDIVISGRILGIEQSRSQYLSGISPKNNKEWKRISITINYWDQNFNSFSKRFITVWGENAEVINSSAFEGQEIEVSCRLVRRKNEKTGEWSDTLQATRVNLGWVQPSTINVPPMNNPQPVVQQKAQPTVKPQELDDSILWD